MKFLSSKYSFIISMAIFGTLGLFVRYIDISSGELAFCRAAMATVFIGSVLLVTRQKIPFGKLKKELFLLMLSGAAMGINWILLFEAYKYTTVSVATLSYYFAPIIVTAVSPLLFKEKMTAKNILCFVMSTVGIVLLTGLGDLSGNAAHLKGIACGLSAAVFYASVMLLNKFTKKVDGIQRTFVQFLSATVVLLPYALLSTGIHLTSLDQKGVLALLTVGFLHTGMTYCLYFSSLKELPGQKAAILSYIDPLVAVVISVLILKESITTLQLLGSALILGFTLWNELSPERARKGKKNEK